MDKQTQWEHGLGDRVVCVITGFRGVIIARVEYFNGCRQYSIQPECDADAPHKIPDAEYIDEGQLVDQDDWDIAKEYEREINEQQGGPQRAKPPARYGGK